MRSSNSPRRGSSDSSQAEYLGVKSSLPTPKRSLPLFSFETKMFLPDENSPPPLSIMLFTPSFPFTGITFTVGVSRDACMHVCSFESFGIIALPNPQLHRTTFTYASRTAAQLSKLRCFRSQDNVVAAGANTTTRLRVVAPANMKIATA